MLAVYIFNPWQIILFSSIVLMSRKKTNILQCLFKMDSKKYFDIIKKFEKIQRSDFNPVLLLFRIKTVKLVYEIKNRLKFFFFFFFFPLLIHLSVKNLLQK